MLFRTSLLAALLFLSACAGNGRSTSSDTGLAASPPGSFTRISTADLRNGHSIDIGVNLEVIDGDSHAQLIFPISLSVAMTDAKATQTNSIGDGLAATSPIRFSGITAPNELEAAANYLAGKFKERRQVIGELYRSPEKQYLMLLAFATDNGLCSRYFDVTAWVMDIEAPFSN